MSSGETVDDTAAWIETIGQDHEHGDCADMRSAVGECRCHCNLRIRNLETGHRITCNNCHQVITDGTRDL